MGFASRIDVSLSTWSVGEQSRAGDPVALEVVSVDVGTPRLPHNAL